MESEEQKEQRRIRAEGVLAFLFAWILLTSFLSYGLGTGNVYAVGQIHLYDPKIFAGNLYLDDSVMSPRLVLDSFIALLMKLNGGYWAPAAYFVTCMGVIAYAAGETALLKAACRKNILPCVILFTLVLYMTQNNIGANSTCPIASINIGGSFGFGMLAAAFAMRKKFNTAWLMCTFAALWHIHEGIYSAAVVFLLFLIDAIQRRFFSLKENYFILLYVAVILSTVIPNMLTDSTTLSNQEFVDIYVKYELPMHLQVSTWESSTHFAGISSGFSTVIRSLLVVVCFYLLRVESMVVQKRREEIKGFSVRAGILFLALVLSVVVEYVFTEVYPLAFIATMYIPKFSKYVVILALLWIVQSAGDALSDGNYLSALALASCPCAVRICTNTLLAVALAVAALVVFGERAVRERFFGSGTAKKLYTVLAVLGAAVWLTLYALALKLGTVSMMLIYLLGALCLCAGSERWRKSRKTWIATGVACAAMILTVFYGRAYTIDQTGLRLRGDSDLLKTAVGANEDIYQLAKEFEEKTTEDEWFLADPNDNPKFPWFQVMSRRNAYVSRKVSPSVKCNLEEWYRRMMETTDIFEKDPSVLKTVLRQNGISYVLVNRDDYDKIQALPEFSVFCTCDGDSYRVYRFADA